MAITFYKKKLIYREDGRLYLIRRTLFTCDWFSIKIHNILLSDYDCLHDHPWRFITILLKGSYIENALQKEERIEYMMGLGGDEFTEVPIQRTFKAGNILYRPADYKHSLKIEKPVWSLVITFKKVRDWGFWTSKGWIFWQDYTSTKVCE